MAKTCDKCAHWTPSDSIKRPNEGTCSSDKFAYIGEDTIEPDELGYSDYEGYSANFNTGPKFGCIHWQKRVKP